VNALKGFGALVIGLMLAVGIYVSGALLGWLAFFVGLLLSIFGVAGFLGLLLVEVFQNWKEERRQRRSNKEKAP